MAMINTYVKVVKSGMPDRPAAPPVNGMARISTRMISPNPNVKMAR